MSRVIYSLAAESDFLEITAFIARDKPEAAYRWVETMRKKCELLSENPEMGEKRHGFGVPGCRSHTVGNYVVFYRSIEDGIHVSRVIHGSRDLMDL